MFGPHEKEEEFVFLQAVDEANDDLKRTDWLLEGDTISYTIRDSFYLSKQSKCHNSSSQGRLIDKR